jgi:protein-disulfide isomerase
MFKDGFTIEHEASLRLPIAAMGVDSTRFEQCLASGQFAGRVAAQRADGIRRRINATPTLYVNGRRYDGVLSPAELRKVLQQ